MIEIHGLTKHYCSLTAVEGLSLTVQPGEWFLFCGPNGAGKTTTIRMLMGLVAPTDGTARVFGHEVGRESLEVRRIAGYLPEDFYAYGYLSGREYLEFVADIHGLPRDEKRKRIDSLLALFAFEEEGGRYVKTYSHGMKKKLGLCAALVHKPKVAFLDEPTEGLDPGAAALVRKVIRSLCDAGMIVFMSTHLLGVAEKLCDRVGVLHHGKLLCEGKLADVQALHPGLSLEEIYLRLTGGVADERISKFMSGS